MVSSVEHRDATRANVIEIPKDLMPINYRGLVISLGQVLCRHSASIILNAHTRLGDQSALHFLRTNIFSGARSVMSTNPETSHIVVSFPESSHPFPCSGSSARLARAIVLAVETGLRRSELFGLTVELIDLKRREIVLDQTKSGAPRRVPLSALAKATIQEVLADEDRPKGAEYLFARTDGTCFIDFKKGFAAACHRAKITGLRWHDLRHTFASWFVQSGGDLYHLSRLLGHSTVQMSARYGHLRTHDLHEALERVSQNRSQDRLTETSAGPETIS